MIFAIIGAVMLFIGLVVINIVASVGSWVVDTMRDDPTPTPYVFDPDSCYGVSSDECREIWFDKIDDAIGHGD